MVTGLNLFFRCRQEKYGLGIGYYFYLNSSYNAILFRYYSSVGKYKFVLPITYDIETADAINPNILFSFVSLPIIGASFYRYYKGKDLTFMRHVGLKGDSCPKLLNLRKRMEK